jgi:hypothetical protein
VFVDDCRRYFNSNSCAPGWSKCVVCDGFFGYDHIKEFKMHADKFEKDMDYTKSIT